MKLLSFNKPLTVKYGVSFFATFLILHFFSCTKKSESSTTSALNGFFVTGQVVDVNGLGIMGIKIFYNSDSFVVTNDQGFWHTKNLFDSVYLQPKDSNFVFSPALAKATKKDNTIVFIASPLTQQSINAQKIYNWLIAMQLPNGLLESTENSNIVSLYDNALAALVFMAKNDFQRAELIFNFFNNKINSELLEGNGGFSQLRDKNGQPNGNRWIGDNAWLLIALNNYKEKTNNNQYQVLSTTIANWIIQQQDMDGGLWGGFDNTGAKIGKVTEGMIDAFNAVSGFTQFHKNLLNYLKINRWSSADNLLMAWPGNKYLYAMDNHSWGYCTFEDFPYGVLQKADIYVNTKTATINNKTITGYCFDIDKDNIWLEGTGQMVVAFNKAKQINIAQFYLSEIEKLIIPSSLHANTLGIPYSSNLGTHYGTSPLWVDADTKPCISSGAWYLFGYLKFDPMSIGYSKNIPAIDKFW